MPGFRRHPRLAYVPCRLSMVPRLFHGPLAPDVVVVHTHDPRDGQVSLGLEVNVLPAAIEAARERGALVVAQLNPRMPWTFGDAVLPLDAVDLGVEVDVPLTTHLAAPPSEDARLIGARVAAEIGDGATLQAGIGEVPDATIAGVLERRGLKVWTEMFSDGVLVLERAGALDRGTPVRTSFVFGSEELYDWVDDNPRVRMLRTETTNSPAAIAQQPAMTSINTALQVDLFDQANASRIGTRIYSGFGGQTDFTVGASHSPGGRAFIALRSWHPARRRLHDRAARRRAGDVVPARRGGHRAGHRLDVGPQRARAGAQPHRARRAPARPRRPLGGGTRARAGLTPRPGRLLARAQATNTQKMCPSGLA